MDGKLVVQVPVVGGALRVEVEGKLVGDRIEGVGVNGKKVVVALGQGPWIVEEKSEVLHAHAS